MEKTLPDYLRCLGYRIASLQEYAFVCGSFRPGAGYDPPVNSDSKPVARNRHRPARRLCAWFVLASFLAAQAPRAGDEEFLGPFPSWRDLKRDHGAAGDGKADDTAALQRGLDELVKHTNACVLYLPAGVYRVTGTLRTRRQAHTDCQGVTLIGEDPARTILRWDGPAGATLLEWDAWYSKVSRLTLDGAGRARAALRYGPAFSTYNETSDITFQDAAIGLLFGEDQTQGQAENEVLRCRFLRCAEAGVVTRNWNSMDIWVWYSRFEDCGHGLLNVMGNFHGWQNLFLRSTVADIATRNLMVFSFVNNTSQGSRRFLDFDSGHTWGAPTTISGNRVLDPAADFPLKLGSAGPYLVMDNVIRLPQGSTNRAVKMTWADQSFVGNLYSTTNAVLENGRFRRLAERTAERRHITDGLPILPSAPARRARPVIELAAGADADALQEAVHQAAGLTGQRPVIHLPMGAYPLARTVTLPRGCDLQLVGDGAGETATRLNWTGPAGGLMLRLEGPTRAVLRDLYLHAPDARAVLVENADHTGGRIFADQLNVSGPASADAGTVAALRVNGLDRTDVLLRALQGSGNAGAWAEVVGGPLSREGQARNQVSIFNGATGSAAGQYNVRQGGRLVVRGVYHEKSADTLRGLYLADSGTLAIDATRFSYKTSPQAPLVAAAGFRGWFTIATGLLLPVDSTNTCRFEFDGDGSRAHILALNDQFWVAEHGVTAAGLWLDRAQPPVHGGLVGCNVNSNTKGATTNGFAFLANLPEHPDMSRSRDGSGPLADRGAVDDAALLAHLAPLREARVWLPGAPGAGDMDLRFHRVMVSGGTPAAVEFRAQGVSPYD
jgi:hypothetical protein